jgi:hypothetical protein
VPTIPSWRDIGPSTFGPFSSHLCISQRQLQSDRKVDLGIDRHEYEDFFLPFYEVWSHLEGTDTKILQVDACPGMLTNLWKSWRASFFLTSFKKASKFHWSEMPQADEQTASTSNPQVVFSSRLAVSSLYRVVN